ncbi:MAG: nucleotide-binding protein, partial [Candidatus Krumholzibacteriota bacterium]|nr:nucleotide-binding protein [Candidatus Krumholzibacteriota bacterium]
MTGTQTSVGRSVALDPAGNVLITGLFGGSMDFGGGLFTSVGNQNIFVAKYDPDGAHLWSRRFGDALKFSDVSIATDNLGNVLVAGNLAGTADFGGGTLTPDIFVAKFDANGTHIWSKSFPGGGRLGDVIATDDFGNVVLAGAVTYEIDFGGGLLTGTGNWDVFVAKFAADGSHLWSHRFHTDFHSGSCWSAATDTDGNIVLTGMFDDTIDFGGGILTSSGAQDVFVVRFAADGSHVWSQRFGGTGFDLGQGIAVDAVGSVIVSGIFNLTADFGGSDLTSAGGNDLFVA